MVTHSSISRPVQSGLLLTCSHCVAESLEEYAEGNPHWLIFSSGQVVQAKCVAWDARRDLALLQIVAAEDLKSGSLPAFPHATMASAPPAAPRMKKTKGSYNTYKMPKKRSNLGLF